MLLLNNIQLLVDIREKPYSRKEDFCKKNLSLHLAKADIEYLHLKQPGSSQKLRDKENGDYNYFFTEYKKHLESQSDALDQLLNIMHDKTLCPMCYEKEENRCHRKAIAETLTLNETNLNIIHLKPARSHYRPLPGQEPSAAFDRKIISRPNAVIRNLNITTP